MFWPKQLNKQRCHPLKGESWERARCQVLVGRGSEG